LLLFPGQQFLVKVLVTELAKRCGLEGEHILLINSRGIILKDLATGKSMTTFVFSVVRNFESRKGEFRFEIGRRGPKGEGLIWVKVMDSKGENAIKAAIDLFARK